MTDERWERLAERCRLLLWMGKFDGHSHHNEAHRELADAILDAARVVAREEVASLRDELWTELAAHGWVPAPPADPASVDSAPAPSFPSAAAINAARKEWHRKFPTPGYGVRETVAAALAVDRPAIEEAAVRAFIAWRNRLGGYVPIADAMVKRFLAERKEGK